MNFLSCCFFILFSITPYFSFAQIISPSSADYGQSKKEGKISVGDFIINGDTLLKSPVKIQPPSVHPASVTCSCMIPVDASFSVVPMNAAEANPPFFRNDDGSSGQIALPFNFCFYGSTNNNCFINNNGNISFGAQYGTFTANAFPDPSFIMIAPFWGDVDTRNFSSGLVYYKVTSTYMIVRWQNVGYYNTYADKLNDFQLIITNGSDPILPNGNNVSFCYGDMQWTTGDASGGQNGFGGTPATVGVNRGNGIDYIQIGRFDQPGTSYDGPFGNPDEVSWLDNQTFYFNVCNNGSGNNLPPIINSDAICDTLFMCIGDTLDFSATFLSPEQGQITTATMTTAATGFSVVNSTPGNPAVINAVLVADATNAGLNTITITGTDNGSPPAVTSVNVFVTIVNAPYVNFSAYPPSPQITGTMIQFTDFSAGAVSWFWDFGDGANSTQQNPQHAFSSLTDSVFIVSLTTTLAGGCTGTDTIHFRIVHEPLVLTIPNVVTPNGDGVNDFFHVGNLEDYYPGSKLEVFNRWGNSIYTNEDYRNDWRPDVTDGTYYYILTIPGFEKPFTGFFVVIKGK
ncbi:hypothetical protein BH11BAC7_BH11BAC7_28790 [soil metagenome]